MRLYALRARWLYGGWFASWVGLFGLRSRNDWHHGLFWPQALQAPQLVRKTELEFAFGSKGW